MKRFYIFLIGIATANQFYAQTDSLPKPIENVFDVVWMDTILLKERESEPLINGNLLIPPYGNDGCYMLETGKKLYYTFSPHQKIIKKNNSSRYVLFKTDRHNLIFDIETGKEVYDNYYEEEKDEFRAPYKHQNLVILSRYVCFASGSNTLTCVDTATMKEKWIFETESKLFDQYIEYKQVIYINSEKYLYAIDINTGLEKWKIEVGKSITNMKLENGILYLCIYNKGIFAINLESKSIVYKQDYIENARKVEIVDDLLYYVDNNVFAFELLTGKLKFYSKDYASCTNTDSFFLFKDYLFSQSCARCNYFLEGFDRFTGKKMFKASDDIANKEVKDFLINATYFSPTYKNMIFATSMAEIKDKFWIAKIYGVKIRTEDIDE